jgi:hypothetical protein
MATKKPAVTAKVAVQAKKIAAKKAAAKAAPAKKAPTKKVAEPTSKKKAPTKKVAEPKLKVGASAKAAATKKQEPYISVVSVELDPDNVQNGAFELDWNDIFVARLVKAGYKGRDDAQIVDQWFQDICKNVLAENFEQWEVNQPIESRIQRRDIGGGKTEVS